VPDDRRAGVVFALAAQAEMSLFVFQVIAPLPQICWGLQNSLFIHRVIGASKNRDKQIKYTVLLAAGLFYYIKELIN